MNISVLRISIKMMFNKIIGQCFLRDAKRMQSCSFTVGKLCRQAGLSIGR